MRVPSSLSYGPRVLYERLANSRSTAVRSDEVTWSGPELLSASGEYLQVLFDAVSSPERSNDELSLGSPSSRAGDRVLVLCEPSAASVAVVVAHHVAGIVHTPLSSACTDHELLHVLADASPVAIVVDVSAGPRLASLLAILTARSATPAEQGAAPPIAVLAVGLRLGATGATCSVTCIQRTRPKRSDTSSQGEAAGGLEALSGAVGSESTALLIYTSGTTGRPKGVELSYRAVLGAMSSLAALWGFNRDDEVVVSLPLFHVHGLAIGIFASLLSGARVALLRKFTPGAVVKAIDDGGTVFLGVPTMYARLLEHMEADSSAATRLARARLYTAGSAALVPQHFDAFFARTGHRILERYGMSETLITLSNPLHGERRCGSVGQVVPGFEIRVVDEQGLDVEDGMPGELWVRGVGLMSGYHGRADASAEVMRAGGWLGTGDIVERDAAGYVRVLGRSSVDIIKSGGFKISALEIEDALSGAPGFKELAVVGLADPSWGQVVAVVGVSNEANAAPQPLLEELVALAEAKLSKYKLPRALVLIDQLPRSPLGKVQKPAISARIVAGELSVYRSRSEPSSVTTPALRTAERPQVTRGGKTN